MKYFIKILFVTIILFYYQHSMAVGDLSCEKVINDIPSTYPAVIEYFKQHYRSININDSIEKWKHIANIILIIGLVVSLFGAILTVLQSRDGGRGLTILTAVLGVSLVLLNTARESLPGGSYLAYQGIITSTNLIKGELEPYLEASLPMEGDNKKEILLSICQELNDLRALKKTYPTNIPPIFNWFISPADAAPDWWDSAIGIKASGTGSSRIEAKVVAEKQGLIEIQKSFQSKFDLQLNKPIFNSIRQGIMDASMLAVQKKSEYFEDGTPISYWILYQIDNSFVDTMINSISFPLIIFRTDFIEPMIGNLNKELSDYGFNVTEEPAVRGPRSETNAIFVGSGVPIDAIKKTVEELVKANIPIKAIIYPWVFQNSKLAEKQKLNLIQIGGTKMLEPSSNFSEERIETLKAITSQDEMVLFCKEHTEALKKSWGLESAVVR